MKHTPLLLLLFTVTVICISCKKEENTNIMDFKVTGVKDITVAREQNGLLHLKVFYLGGNKENVQLSATGFPVGVSIEFSPDKGEPDFELSAFISVSAIVDTGDFPVIITAVSEEGKKQFSKTFQLSIRPKPDKSPVIGLYGSTDYTGILNASYLDSGYIAFDDEDGNITANVVVTGSVNKDSTGTYIISYVVVDSFGNKDSVIRRVKIKNQSEFLNGSYTCTPNQPLGLSPCLTDISITDSINNKVYCYNGTNCYSAKLLLDVDRAIFKISVDTQTWFFNGALHTYSGQGTYSLSGTSVNINMSYVDMFIDSIGNNISIFRSENYFKF